MANLHILQHSRLMEFLINIIKKIDFEMKLANCGMVIVLVWPRILTSAASIHLRAPALFVLARCSNFQ